MSYHTPMTWSEKFLCKECGCNDACEFQDPQRDFVPTTYCFQCHTPDYQYHRLAAGVTGVGDIWDHLGRNSSAQERRQMMEPWIRPKRTIRRPEIWERCTFWQDDCMCGDCDSDGTATDCDDEIECDDHCVKCIWRVNRYKPTTEIVNHSPFLMALAADCAGGTAEDWENIVKDIVEISDVLASERKKSNFDFHTSVY